LLQFTGEMLSNYPLAKRLWCARIWRWRHLPDRRENAPDSDMIVVGFCPPVLTATYCKFIDDSTNNTVTDVCVTSSSKSR